ncbi:carbohydrate ABC transporter permease [Pseudoduganella namucuonensis]|uniref:Trehalose/maltose transport system permease protein n=1 Tax=Pseudoduganella namucuonensis TaxID=1035707 RepID=A0A1I7JX84_9BURK|nr:carbohydrate ABC transporter permease [Pseudoduganella namucuonensis]SFU89813.1 trehalose/maltose transport system permease protein [Pseudoduganella namucuonensis]
MKKIALRAGFAGLVGLIVLYSIFPFYYAIVTSLKDSGDLFRAELFPARLNLDNYAAVFREQAFGENIANSVLVSASVVGLSLGLALLAAYPLCRIPFRGRATLLMTILGVSMFPQVAVLSGMFELIRALGLYNNLLSMTLSYMIFSLPFTVWVLTTFMRELPQELEDAAMIDGASTLTLIVRIYLPLMGPAMVTTGLLAFITAWNEFLFALTFTLSTEQRTIPVAIGLISGASQHELPWGNIMAASVTVTVPVVLLVLAFQRRIVSGLTAGAVKG